MRTPARGCTLVICLSRAWSAATIAIIRSVSSDTWVVIARSLLRWVSSVADSLAVTSSNWVAIAWAVVPTGPVAAIVEGLWRALFGL